MNHLKCLMNPSGLAIFVAALLGLLTIIPSKTLAHEFVRDHDIGALLHIEPDDEPSSNTPTTLLFEVTQRGGSIISSTNCVCVVSLYKGEAKGKALSTIQAQTNKNTQLTAVVRFPVIGAYTIVLEGKPQNTGLFAPFRLSWVVRADR